MQFERKDLIKVIFPIILIQGLLAFLGGIVRLTAHNIQDSGIIPPQFEANHPELVIYSFFALLIMFERWQGISIYENRPKFFTEPFLFLMIIGTLLLTFSTGLGSQSDYYLDIKQLAWILIFVSILWFLLIQIWFLIKYPAYFATTFFLILGYGLLEANVIAILLEIIRYDFGIIYIASIAIIILGERIDLAQIGAHYSKKGKNAIPILVFLGFGFFITALIALFLDIKIVFQLSFIFMAIYTIILLFYDITLYSVPDETPIRTFQKWGLRGGYIWLLFGIFLLEINSEIYHILTQSSAVHAIALGFIITMLLSHAPIILPSLIYQPFITRIFGGLWWLILFWGLIAIRVGGNLLFVIFEIDISLYIELTGYLSIPVILGYLIALIYEMRKNVKMGNKIIGNL
ncbi:MAG: hypothetical protein HeimC3_22930 [Candidatus Heimdallarchaeota archaeon LC_3]|nr:MAG: hypothetical protein HeimC3_22930 [Candidatus Heimdallarchaeota archaeon LC_3]